MSEQRTFTRYTLAAGFFIAYWAIEAVVDRVLFVKGPFLKVLFPSDPHELWIRGISGVVITSLLALAGRSGGKRREVEQALSRSEELTRSFLASSGSAIFIVDLDGKLLTGNQGFFLKYGLSDPSASGRGISSLLPHAVADGALQLLEKIRSGAPSAVTTLDGDEEMSAYPVGDATLPPEKVLLVTRDISSYKQAEAELQASRQRYRSIFAGVGAAAAVLRPDGVLQEVNRQFEVLTGYTAQELEGKMSLSALVPAQYHPQMLRFQSDAASFADGRNTSELFLVSRYGEEKAVLWEKASLEGSRDTVNTFRDLTAQKLVEDALNESRTTLAVVQRMSRMGNWNWDVVADTLTWSDEMYRIFGVNPAEFTPTYEGFLQMVHPEDREMVIKSINNALYNRKPYALDHRIVMPSGSVCTITTMAEVSFDAAGNPLRMFGTNQDINWRKEAEDALKRSEEKFSKAFHASPDAIVITRAEDGTYIEVNEAFQEMTGYSREEVMGQTSSSDLRLWADPDARMTMLKLMNQYGHVRNLEVRFRVKSGEIREVLWSADVIEYQGEACLIAISRDVTEQRHLEQELLRSEAKLYMKHEELKNLFQQMEAIRREWEETMDCISDLFILADQGGKIRRFNRAVEAFSGKAHRDIVGRDWPSFLEEHGMKQHLDAPGVELFHAPSGRWFVLKRYAFPAGDGEGGTREVIIVNDTTDIRHRGGATACRITSIESY